MAINSEMDNDLVTLNAEHLFGLSSCSQIAIKNNCYIKPLSIHLLRCFRPTSLRK